MKKSSSKSSHNIYDIKPIESSDDGPASSDLTSSLKSTCLSQDEIQIKDQLCCGIERLMELKQKYKHSTTQDLLKEAEIKIA